MKNLLSLVQNIKTKLEKSENCENQTFEEVLYFLHKELEDVNLIFDTNSYESLVLVAIIIHEIESYRKLNYTTFFNIAKTINISLFEALKYQKLINNLEKVNLLNTAQINFEENQKIVAQNYNLLFREGLILKPSVFPILNNQFLLTSKVVERVIESDVF